ncbi:MAG: DUF1854 domain-containing protein [Gemmatimonadetes bacterium]|nr:DUF1854 domain-containing protein [Gemmatimonadota bacterium]MYB58395.1 DUF1854 domain-containing protein [Gemmatimonadota bacterium]
MNLDPAAISLKKNGDKIEALIHGKTSFVDRLARAFPHSNPDQFVSLMDELGHEIGIIENPKKLDDTSRNLLEAELKAIYFVPTISAITSVVPKGTGSQWTVDTDDGEYTFRILGRDALKGDEPPAIEITDENGKRYKIDNYWDLDAESRDLTSDLLPDKVVKARYYTRSISSSRSGRGRGSSSRGGSSSGGSSGSSGMGGSIGIR